MEIRMKRDVRGTFHGIREGVNAGDVVDVDEENALRYIELGYAEHVWAPVPEAVPVTVESGKPFDETEWPAVNAGSYFGR